MREFDFIRLLQASTPGAPHVDVGIGDDAAILTVAPQVRQAIAVDTLLEGVHFEMATATPEQIGRKCLAVNLSDIAAMAGQPHSAVIGAAFRRTAGDGFAPALQAGMQQLADEFNVAIVGGDTNTWDHPTSISVSVLATEPSTGFKLRSGAKPGDAILVTGHLGGSLRGHHLSFTPRVAEALALADMIPVHGLIDLSDGLASDLQHILRASRVGAEIIAEHLPISAAVDTNLNASKRWEHALSDGEDFELLFTTDERSAERLLKSPPFATPLQRVGTITKDTACVLVTPSGRQPLKPTGWEHQF